MGLLNFWKKKDLDLPLLSPLDDQALASDLPSIDGGNIDGSNVEKMPPLPQADDSKQTDGSKSISFNVPTLDFSLPLAEDLNLDSSKSPSSSQNGLGDSPTVEEDMNKLFLNDETWKEPDWTNFEPYPEEKIDEPKIEDFKGADLPQFDDGSTGEPVSEPAEPFKKSQTNEKPLELFIRGRAYNRVFIELDQMNKALTLIDTQTSGYEDMLKREEPILLAAKEQTEYLYRKMNLIDKKIFVQE
jgi:hypothetical protein